MAAADELISLRGDLRGFQTASEDWPGNIQVVYQGPGQSAPFVIPSA